MFKVLRISVFLLFALAFQALFASCAGKMPPSRSMDLSDSVYWAPATPASTIYSAQGAQFRKLDFAEIKSLSNICGPSGCYLWLRIRFDVPNQLKFRSLGFVISRLHAADMVWLNDLYIGSTGKFPPREKSSLFASRCYFFPESAVLSTGTNTILMKVWVHGIGGISDEIFLSDYDSAAAFSGNTTFWNSRVYMLFEGMMFCALVLYLMMYLWSRRDTYFISFALLNMGTMVFFTYFFAPEFPFYNSDSVSYVAFTKAVLCISFYFTVFFASFFMLSYLRMRPSASVICVMLTLLLAPTIATAASPTYSSLIGMCRPFLVLMAAQILIGLYYGVRAFRGGGKGRRHALVLLAGFLPLIVAGITDFVSRGIMGNVNAPYFSAFGWQISIAMFLFALSMRFSQVSAKNKYLNASLAEEVARQTKSLSEANARLSEEMRRSEVDLEMAAIVQQKFFPFPETVFRGWDVAVCYKAAASVSGDLYDYYHTGERLDGISLFDVSGHGVSAGLITMLSKSVIHSAFRGCVSNLHSVSSALYRVNQSIIEAKGDIENYLTGVLLRFSAFGPGDVCQVQLANAGHPRPILYSAERQCAMEVSGNSERQYGAIGIRGIDVSFPEIDFSMGRGDVLVCFTDGLTESMNSAREMYGKERLLSLMDRVGSMDAQSILEEIIDSLMLFMGNAERDDDLTIIVLKRISSQDYIGEILDEL